MKHIRAIAWALLLIFDLLFIVYKTSHESPWTSYILPILVAISSSANLYLIYKYSKQK